ncbi:hypothetical protein [Microbacterium aurantiacum]|uniref:hypothetical protein n=1 Tax=Microbacterium aurantiacum TaxID=162393 RepID=UPI0007DAB2BC|nr:hypothetical protein [Microbacterium chocolatum]ANG86889.1 hypothetical protein A8L33_15055 [Microbacterium chocolatum]
MLDEVASSVAFDERWSVAQRRLLDEESLAAPLGLLLGAGRKLDDLRSLARAFGSDWDLIAERVLAKPLRARCRRSMSRRSSGRRSC